MKYAAKILFGVLFQIIGFVIIFFGMYYKVEFPTWGRILGFISVVFGYYVVIFTFLNKENNR